MTQSLSISGGVSTTVSLLVRTVIALVIFAALFFIIRRAIVMFIGARSLQLSRRKYWYFGINLLIVVILAMTYRLTEAALSTVGKSLDGLAPLLEAGWAGTMLTGLFYTILATLILVLLIQAVGAVFWTVERQLDRWAQRQAAYPPTSLRRHLRRGFSLLNHAFRATALVFILLAFIPMVLRYFPRTRAVVDAADLYLGHPTRDVAQAIVNYLPNLVYLAIIIAVGWLLGKLLKYFFNSLADGSLTISGFLPEWAVPTFKLCRALLFLFVLMISYPYLPGSSTEAFKGFSVFVGALVTFGSSGSINNIVSGLVLTYARAFRVGDMVKIGDVVGIVLEKTTLTTRLRTARNEEVTIPNSIVLASTVVDYSARASSEGLVLTVTAGIGYDVDWRTVEALMIDAARRTGNILADPAPFVLKSDLGDYAVVYDLMAATNLTDQPDRLLRTSSALRQNVLDAFNAAGVEIMTPSVLAHRDASGLAVPPERFPDRPAARGIRIDLSDEKNSGA